MKTIPEHAIRRAAIGALLLFLGLSAQAESVYQTPAEFIDENLGVPAPAPQTLWIDAELRAQAKAATGRQLTGLRIRYWQRDSKTLWILEEIGKELPITTGVVINAGAIETIRVLIFRESRGWEVRYPFFTDQFVSAQLTEKLRLDRDIDNISGATLSVNALKRQARLALLLTRHIGTQP